MSFRNARKALEQKYTYLLDLEMTASDAYRNCAGHYHIAEGTVNEFPYWERTSGGMWLYSTPNGYWRVTDSKNDFLEGSGYIISLERHSGMPPESILEWCTAGKVDPHVRVTQFFGSGSVDNSPTKRRASAFSANEYPTQAAGYPNGLPRATTKSVILKVARQPREPLGMVFLMPFKTLADVRQGSPAERTGAHELIGWEVTHINGEVVEQHDDIVRMTEGKTKLALTMTPPEDGEPLDPALWAGKSENVWVKKHIRESLGIQLLNMILTEVQHGSPAQRHGLGALIGRKLIHVNYVPVGSWSRVMQLSTEQTECWIGFAPVSPPVKEEDRSGMSISQQMEKNEMARSVNRMRKTVGPSTSPDRRAAPMQPPDAITPGPMTPNRQASPWTGASGADPVEVELVKRAGTIGCKFAGSGPVFLQEILPGTPAAEAGMAAHRGRVVSRVQGAPVSSPHDVYSAWTAAAAGQRVSLVLEDHISRRPSFPNAAYQNFVNAYTEHPNAGQTTPPYHEQDDWIIRRANDRTNAAASPIRTPNMGAGRQ
ncbi:hypothetical protein DIPPA_11491 [Diplonema papillatum]|nr:hypothetical protein DIPPA_11491 [Diplonema papillatum]|eukprot:gene2256-3485_t